MKLWHWIALGGLAVVGYFVLRGPKLPSVLTTPPIGAPPPAVLPTSSAGPSSEARSGRGHF